MHPITTYISLCATLCTFRIAGTDLTIWGTGSPLRQFIFSEDLARLTVSAGLTYCTVYTIPRTCGPSVALRFDHDLIL